MHMCGYSLPLLVIAQILTVRIQSPLASYAHRRTAPHSRVPHRVFADLHVQLVPFSRTPLSRGDTDPAPRTGPPDRMQTHKRANSRRKGPSSRLNAQIPPRSPALPSSTSQPPSPGAAALRAGRGGAGGGAGWREALAQKAEGPELLATADRHTVFWNSSNPNVKASANFRLGRVKDRLWQEDRVCVLFSAPSKAKGHGEEWEVEREAESGQTRKVRITAEQEEGGSSEQGLREESQRVCTCVFSQRRFLPECSVRVYLAAKPIHHQEDQCLRLKVTVNGKTTHSPQAHANPQEKRLPADDPEVQVLHSIGHSAAPRLFPLAWAVLLLPFLLLQTP
ncbi:ephrin-A1-like [Eumetopias jubatus]|uniref:ephrin-A1-like n=1 Tax=Eumetopias jubatus TaxID=34886 RepID=UPI0010164F8B|nr:ephrin-A1-like [Eumetopias jubatus]